MRVPDEIAGEAASNGGSGEDLDKIIRRLLDGQLYGVLCTQGQGQPYGSAYRRSRARGKHHLNALVKTASLLARISFRMLRDNKPFDPNHGRAGSLAPEASGENQCRTPADA